MAESEYFKGRAYLVTGSSRGIGRAVAEWLLDRGACVSIHGRDAERVGQTCEALRGRAGKPLPLVADLDDPDAAAGLVEAFMAASQRLDGVVNNAGGGRAVAFRGLTVDTWRAVFRQNLEAAMLISQAAYNRMRKQRSGSLVQVASIAAHGPGKWMGADYAASKAGLVSLTRSLAFEAARFGIRANAVSPGFVETDMTASLTPRMREDLRIPMGRLARPEEVASVIGFLLSDQSSYLTGQVIHINGGARM
jgi:3-oxoacyl-[acyl-carrier protein] reductase